VRRAVKRAQRAQAERLGLGSAQFSMAAAVKRASVSPALRKAIGKAEQAVQKAVKARGGKDYYSVYESISHNCIECS